MDLTMTEFTAADSKSLWDVVDTGEMHDSDAEVHDADQDKPLLPRVKEDLVLRSTSRTETFIICELLGANRARELAVDAAKRNMKLLPWGGVAARISRDPGVTIAIEHGKAFCSLPLPVITGLPIHVRTLLSLRPALSCLALPCLPRLT